MRKELLKNSSIDEEIYTSNVDLNQYVDSNTGVLKIPNNINYVKGNTKDNSKTIYKGYNSKIYDSEKLAKESYLKINEAYNFNDLYFKNKLDLKQYLEIEYLKNDEVKFNSIVLKGPNGVKSSPIDLNGKNAINAIDSFIETNAKKSFKLY